VNISVVVPVYNGKKYLKEAIESVISQTLLPLEMILVDDGSTDDSIDSVREIKAPFPIHFFHQVNAGQSAARNFGIKKAKGELIALLDQDDVWYTEHLEQLIKPFHEKSRMGWVYSDVDEIDDRGFLLKQGLISHNSQNLHPKKSVESIIERDLFVLPSASLISKEAILKAGMFDERLFGTEDDDLFLRIFLNGWKHEFLPNSQSAWRIHSSSCGHSDRLIKSWYVFSQKLIDTFDYNHGVNRFCAKHLIGNRIFQHLVGFYRRETVRNNSKRCKELMGHLNYFVQLLPTKSRIKWKFLLQIMKYPKLLKTLLLIK
jgi:glycosyltransferase involved in cell wall biosynthesis